ncbi:hypothetical protein AB1L30_01270 [Bremerella sp. JC817]|uniref:hypothetical protein n=1 Tax=Bremerella sp. JC817 TaxID=3231756 RepID=UPI003457E21A
MNPAEQTTQFTDSKNRKWDATVDVPTVKQIRNLLKVDLLELLNGRHDVLQKLIDDPILLVDALYLVCREQCQSRNITDEEFGRGLVGDGIDNAVDAFLVGVAHFFPKGRRQVVLGVIQKLNQSLDRVTAKSLQALADPRVDQAIDREADQAIEKWLKDIDRPGSGGS